MNVKKSYLEAERLSFPYFRSLLADCPHYMRTTVGYPSVMMRFESFKYLKHLIR